MNTKEEVRVLFNQTLVTFYTNTGHTQLKSNDANVISKLQNYAKSYSGPQNETKAFNIDSKQAKKVWNDLVRIGLRTNTLDN